MRGVHSFSLSLPRTLWWMYKLRSKPRRLQRANGPQLSGKQIALSVSAVKVNSGKVVKTETVMFFRCWKPCRRNISDRTKTPYCVDICFHFMDCVFMSRLQMWHLGPQLADGHKAWRNDKKMFVKVQNWGHEYGNPGERSRIAMGRIVKG